MTVRDIRRAPFCWQDKAALRALRAYYDGARLKQRATALAIYLVLTELASNQYEQGRVEVVHRAIWEATGTSESTVKRYLRDFEAIGLVAVERQKLDADISLPNVYRLLTPGAIGGPAPATDERAPGATDRPTPATPGLQQEEPPLNKTDEENAAHAALHSVSRLRAAVR